MGDQQKAMTRCQKSQRQEACAQRATPNNTASPLPEPIGSIISLPHLCVYYSYYTLFNAIRKGNRSDCGSNRLRLCPQHGTNSKSIGNDESIIGNDKTIIADGKNILRDGVRPQLEHGTGSDGENIGDDKSIGDDETIITDGETIIGVGVRP
ncbi:hypothetical protein M407DRAFT_246384 [Tulasnella calospora MUT 4182]|uniref:Uncharacterized protein n=1 Tax=Tulasnella calospora MUT 4182 TaxID=1051891 RepID=A0A0C3KBJ1_9AGAM|nr:hypothetical protein M407DRAFT_246384 [Tulasnella calospora MUT 4182]